MFARGLDERQMFDLPACFRLQYSVGGPIQGWLFYAVNNGYAYLIQSVV